MNLKTKSLFVLCLLLACLLPLTSNPAAADWTIDGDTVYVDDENVYLSATPHTLTQDGWVEFELETVAYDGGIDVVWGFDIPDCTPHNAQIWENYTHELTGEGYFDRVGTMYFYNVTSFVSLGIENYSEYEVDYGNDNNTFLYNISYETNGSVIAAFSSYEEIGDGDDYRLTGHYDKWESYTYYEDYFDWNEWIVDWTEIDYEYGGMNHWWLLENATIVHGVRYKVRAWIDIPFNTEGKYWWALKPHDKTISEAVAEGTFYALDPWWNGGYNHKILITVNSTLVEEMLHNFPVLVVLNQTILDQCDGGNSIRFIDWIDNSTEFYYEIDAWDYSSSSYVWVNVTNVSSIVDTKFWMYFNNTGASDNQHPHDTWNTDFFAVWHMDDNTTSTVNDSTINDNTLTKPGANRPSQTAGKIGYGQLWDNSGEYMTTGSVSTFNFMHNTSGPNWTAEAWQSALCDGNARFWFDNSKDSTSNVGVLAKVRDAADNMEVIIFKGASGQLVVEEKAACYKVGEAGYYTIQFDYDLTPAARVTRNTTVTGTQNKNQAPTADDATYVFTVGARANDYANEWRGMMDEFRISSVRRNSSWLNASWYTSNFTSGFLSYGSVEDCPGGGASPMGVISMVPADAATNVSIYSNLTWDNTSIAGRTLENFTLYFGDTNPPPLIGNTTNKTYDPTLIYNETYYWQINLTDTNGDFNLTTVYSFTTKTPWMNITFKDYYNGTRYNENFTAGATITTGVLDGDPINTTKWYLQIVTDNDLNKTIEVTHDSDELYNISYSYDINNTNQINDSVLNLTHEGGDLTIEYEAEEGYDFTIHFQTAYKTFYPHNATYTNYSTYDGTNYAKAPNCTINYYYGSWGYDPFYWINLGTVDTWWVNHTSPGNQTINRTISVNEHSTFSSGDEVIIANEICVFNSTYVYDSWAAGVGLTFIYDSEAPEYDTPAVVTMLEGINTSTNVNITLFNLTDITPENMTVNLSVNSGASYYENTSVFNNTNVTFSNITIQNGVNYFNYTIYDEWGNTVYYNYTMPSIELFNFVCVDEETGAYIDVADFFGLNVTVPERVWKLNLKSKGDGNFSYISNTTVTGIDHPNTIRLEIVYDEVDAAGNNIAITRYYDCTLLPPTENVTRLAVPKYQALFEQLLYSAKEKPFSVYNMEAEGWVCVDYTRMAYETAKAQYAYTIDALYWLRTYNSDGTQNILTTLDGGKPTAINLDILEYQNQTYEFELLTDGLGVKRHTNDTLQIYYLNPANDSSKVYVRLYNSTTTFLHWNETTAPNEFILYFNFSSYGINESDTLTINLTITSDLGVVTYIQESFTLQGKGVATVLLAAAIAAIIAIVFAIFGLTLFSVKNTFSFFGIVICGMAIAVTLLTEQLWYINMIQVILVILILIQLFVYKDEYAGAIK